MTLTELVISLAVAGIMVGGIVTGFLQSAQQAEWSAYSLAAQAQALRGMEQVRAARWDPFRYPPIDEVLQTNFPASVDVLDVPMPGGNISYATNIVTITNVAGNDGLRFIKVETRWRFMNRGVFTNTVYTYRSADQ